MDTNLLYALNEKGEKITPIITEIKDGYKLTFKKSALKGIKKLYALKDLAVRKAGDEGFYLYPAGTNQAWSSKIYFKNRDDGSMISDVQGYPEENETPLPLYALLNSENSFYVKIGMNSLFRLPCNVKNNVYNFYVEYDLENFPPIEDITLTVYPVSENFTVNDLVSAYRQELMSVEKVKTFKERCQNSKDLDYFRKHPYLRIRMAWKPAPSPVAEQTVENEPDVFVACDFDRLIKLMDEMHSQGVSGAEIQLVGFNVSGHDGRWPELLPVEEKLGGVDGLNKALLKAKKYGYHLSCHTNTIDQYTIANTFKKSYSVRNSDLSYLRAGCWSGGKPYIVRTDKQVKVMKKHLKTVKKLGFNGIHYVDVNSIVFPRFSYGKGSTRSVSQSVKDNLKMMRETKKYFGGFSSEGCANYYVKELDFGLYITWGEPLTRMGVLTDELVPLNEMILHGLMMYGGCNNAWNYTVKEPIFKVHQYLIGARPVYYLNQKFFGVNETHLPENDLTTRDDKEIKRAVKEIIKGHKEYEQFIDLQFEKIVDFKNFENGLLETTFESGTKIIGNLYPDEKDYFGTPIKPFSYIVK